MKFLTKENEIEWFENQRGTYSGPFREPARRQSRRDIENYEKIAIYQLIAETSKAWTVQLSQFDDKCKTYPQSQSHLSLSMTGGNNFIYVSKWLLNWRKENGESAPGPGSLREQQREQVRQQTGNTITRMRQPRVPIEF